MTQPRRILIVGSSIAGVSAAEAARQQDPEAEVTIVSQDEFAPYYRLRLCEVLDNPAVAETLFLHPAAWYEERRIRMLLGRRAVQVDPEARTVRLADGETLPYDALVLTTGSQSFVPAHPGHSPARRLCTLEHGRRLDDRKGPAPGNESRRCRRRTART